MLKYRKPKRNSVTRVVGPLEDRLGDRDTLAWAHHVSIKKMSPAPGIKFSRGPGQRVKAFDGTLI
jgi:hypothetical protein